MANQNESIRYIIIGVCATIALAGLAYWWANRGFEVDYPSEAEETEHPAIAMAAEDETEPAGEAEVVEAVDVAVPETPRELTPCDPITMTGRIGGFSATMSLNNGEGVVHLDGNGSRDVSIDSYNAGTGRLVLNAYLNGNYIGQYVGIFRSSGAIYYNGEFYNENNGGVVDFNLNSY